MKTFIGGLGLFVFHLVREYGTKKATNMITFTGGSGLLVFHLAREYGMEGWLYEKPNVIKDVKRVFQPRTENKDLNVHLVEGL